MKCITYVAEIHADTPSFVSGALSGKWRKKRARKRRIPKR
jgi:hypothetical protein